MNHYEELGLQPAATPEEIREAYRNLARLLHPDQQQDEKVRRLAEIQMKRLNAVYAVLSDPDRRRRYDAELSRGSRERRVPVVVPARGEAYRADHHRSQWGNLAWLAAAVAALAGLAWYLAPQTGGLGGPALHAAPDSEVASEANPAAAPLPSPQPATSSPEATPAGAPAVPSQPPPSEAQPETPPEPVADLPPTKLAAEAPAPAREAVPPAGVVLPPAPAAAAPKPVETPRRSFAGAWLYARGKSPAPGGIYPPEFIEASITEDDGVIRGRYRARYRVADRPISPEVFFYFEGMRQGNAASLRWTGGNGARGEVHLKLLSENSLEVVWTATELGRGMGPASGTAVLVRRQEP